ncbi:TnsA-like heteromeric transposase endonuclease subunit [Pseudarthrobacter sp. 1G09]|uniref:TnsA-like heteromeric transposase endonuclease subunit n=1 Tax=Pseudarthrobacter sp. 1G09 TaxID=3416178 RepID=UPI003CF5AA64
MSLLGKRQRSAPGAAPPKTFGRDVLHWIDAEGVGHMAAADSRATGLELHKAAVFRQGIKYPRRRNYEGYYWFSGTGQHLWYESLTEYSALMWLDFSQDIVGISTQPMCIYFADGTSHYPDFFTVQRDGTQTLCDVRPQNLIDAKAAETFAKTRDLCQRIGWPYQILGELGVPMRHNLEWLAAYRHPRYKAPKEIEELLVDFLSEPARLRDVARAIRPGAPAFSIHFVYNLLWTREIRADLARPLSWNTILRKNENV